MSNKTVLIAGNFDFPRGNAAGKRVLGLGYIYKDMGYNVVFAGCRNNRKTNKILDTKQVYEEFVCYNFNGSRSLRNICNVNRAFSELKEIINDIGLNEVGLIVLYGSPVLALWIQKVICFGRKNSIPVVFDCVDWIEKSGFDSGLKNAVKYIDTNFMKRYLACRCNGVIAISKYLYDYYTERGCKTVLIPPVGKMESEELQVKWDNQGEQSPVRIVYAGSMPIEHNMHKEDMKDRIDLSMEIMSKLHERNISFMFDIFGIEKEQYVDAIPEHMQIVDDLSSKVRFHGKTSNDVVCQYISKANFTILNRTITKVTMAGFPSKVSESLLMGTPVITNATSNIVDYVKNGDNGWIVDFDTEVAATQIAVLIQDQNRIRRMKQNCIRECCFEFHLFEGMIKDFIEGL